MEDFLTLDDLYEMYNTQGLTLEDVQSILSQEKLFSTEFEF